MSSNVTDSSGVKTHRPVMLVFLGIFLLTAAGFLVNDRLQVHNVIAPPPQAYKYSVNQAVTTAVQYQKNSFYNGSPGATNTAYIASITNGITAHFAYHLRANQATNLTYHYQAAATVRATSGSEGSDAGLSNVWTKQYQLLKPTAGSETTNALDLNPAVNIPFATYKTAIEQFKAAFNTPVDTQVVVTYMVQVSGNIHGKPFSDNQVSTITAPLDQLVYKLAVGYTKSYQHEVVPVQTRSLADKIATYELPLATILGIIGLAYMLYGFRRHIIKTPYQRELEKIYRYHDGIIIRTSKPADMANKDIVAVKSFDDLLNLEEEIKTPIIASEVSPVTTHFLITRDDIVYVYTLGEPVPFRITVATHAVQNEVTQTSQTPRPKRKVRIIS